MATVASRNRFPLIVNFTIILATFCALTLLAWPLLMSFDLWIFKDRSSFLNLDYLVFTRHYRLGVDIRYSYGLLPVFLQHLAFMPFGRGFKPMIACTLLVMVLSAMFWALLLEHLPPQRRWLFAVVALSPLAYIVNPNWPYSLAILSIFFAFLLTLKDRLDLALAIAAVGSFCVPSIPLLLTLLLVVCILFRWRLDPMQSLSKLAAQLLPGMTVYIILAVLLGLVFSFKSVAATMLPIAGASYYHASGYDKPGAVLAFLHPEGYSFKYYVAYYLLSPVTWFVLCTLFLLCLSVFLLASFRRRGTLSPSAMLIAVFSLMQLTFIFFAYGPRGQHALYEGVLVAATLIGISLIPSPQLRRTALTFFITCGIMAEGNSLYKSVTSWRDTAPGPNTLGLYAGKGIANQWSEIIRLSQHHRTLLLGYATGEHAYYPGLETPDAWIIAPGLLYPKQEQEIIDEIRQADIVVEDGTSPSPIVNDAIESELAKMHDINPGGPYRIWERQNLH